MVLGRERTVLILDDTEGVWPRHRDNLVQVGREGGAVKWGEVAVGGIAGRAVMKVVPGWMNRMVCHRAQ